jgi:hypothetical protein
MYTTHGHHIPGTAIEEKPESVARCGGYLVCRECAVEAFGLDARIKEKESK